MKTLVRLDGFQIVAGLNALTGDEGSGKTRLLHRLSQSLPDVRFVDLRLPEHDQTTPEEIWAQFKQTCLNWNDLLCTELTVALAVTDHLGKRLFMLSAGTRRKVALIALLACGAKVVCLDQPFSALDQASISVLCDFLNDMSEMQTRAWVVADYEADPRLNWANIIRLDST